MWDQTTVGCCVQRVWQCTIMSENSSKVIGKNIEGVCVSATCSAFHVVIAYLRIISYKCMNGIILSMFVASPTVHVVTCRSGIKLTCKYCLSGRSFSGEAYEFNPDSVFAS